MINRITNNIIKNDSFIIALLGSPAIMINSLLRVQDNPGMPAFLNDSRNDNVRFVFDSFKNSDTYKGGSIQCIQKRILFDRIHDPTAFLHANRNLIVNYDETDYKDLKKMIRLIFAVYVLDGTSDTSLYLFNLFFNSV